MTWRTAGAALVVLLCACGSSSAAARLSPSPSQSIATSATPSAAATASPSAVASCAPGVAAGSPPLMAVLERRAAPGSQSVNPMIAYHDTLAIATLNAVARAHATFQPRARPYIGPAETLLSPHEAYVVHGLVYFIDGLGTVWTMGSDGRQVTVARFPIGLSQQEVSFAVSPDGCRLAAAVLTIPQQGPAASGAPFPSLNGTWRLETMTATVGGATQVLHTWTSSDYPGQASGFQNIVVVGWDGTGPLVAVGSPLGTQNGGTVDNAGFFAGTVAYLGQDGVPGPALGGSCQAVQATPWGDITCAGFSSDGQSTVISVVSAAGAVEVAPFSVAGYPDVAVGPGGLIAVTGQWRKGSSTGSLPANFQPEGWIDANTIFGRIGSVSGGSGNAELAHLVGGSATIENLGFVGDYVGMLSA